MASIRKRNGLWQAQVRSRKLGSTSKSFHKKSDAVAWAKVHASRYFVQLYVRTEGDETPVMALQRILGDEMESIEVK